MTEQEVDRIISAIERKEGKSESSKVVEAIFKFVSTASLALVMWVLSTVNSVQKDIVQLSTDAQYMRTSLTKMEAFTDKPRFTQENYDAQTLPIINALNSLTETVSQMEKRLSTMDLERQKMYLAITALENKKK